MAQEVKLLAHLSHVYVALVVQLPTCKLRGHAAAKPSPAAATLNLLLTPPSDAASHRNVVKFYDNFVDNGVMHILMEFATGGTLYKQIVNREVCGGEDPASLPTLGTNLSAWYTWSW